MYRGLFLLAAYFAAIVCGNVIVPIVPMPDGRVIGGEDTTIERYPYQVSVRLLGSHSCGGSILNSRVIVTASHCIYNIPASYYSVSYGSTKVNGGTIITAERLLKHEKYDSKAIDYDIALIFLKSDIPFSSVAQPIELASKAPAAGTPVVVSGWGTTTESGATASILQQVKIVIVDHDICNAQYSGINAITDRMVCAGVPKGGKDACQGDSGGPLVANGQLVGVVSWGVGCARPNLSGVYSNVAILKSWVEANVA